MRFLSRIKYRLWVRRMTAAQKMAIDWEKSAGELLNALSKKEVLLSKTVDQFAKQAFDVKAKIGEIQKHVEKHEKALEALRNENEVLANITIPGLTAACKLQLERWDAETAIQVKRQAVMTDRVEK